MDDLEKSLRDKYTMLKECVVGGEPDPSEPDPHTVWLKVNQQSFCLSGYEGSKEEGEWMRDMIGKALAVVVRETNSLESTLKKQGAK